MEKVHNEKITYIIEGNEYTLVLKQLVKVIDFNKTYSKRLGDNPSLDKYSCELTQCNEYVENKDIVMFLRNIYVGSVADKEKDTVDMIEKGICPKKHIPYLRENFSREKFSNWTPFDYSKFYPSIKIIQNVSKYLPKVSGRGKVYRCSKDMFRLDGRLKKH